MTEEQINDAKAFAAAYANAKECGMETEFFVFFLDDIRRGESVAEAIWYATLEWDL
jgi:hypothetical protein